MKAPNSHKRKRGRHEGIRLAEKSRREELWEWLKTNWEHWRSTLVDAGDLAEPIYQALCDAGVPHPPTVDSFRSSLAGQFNGERTLTKTTIQGLAILCNVDASELRKSLLSKLPLPVPKEKGGTFPRPAAATIPNRVIEMLDEAKELSSHGHHLQADALCDEALRLVKSQGGLPATTIRNKDDLKGLGYYLRVLYYHQWRLAKPRYPVSHFAAVSEATQAELDRRVPIDLSPVQELLDYLHLRECRFPLPINPDLFAQAYTKDAHRRFLQEVTAAVHKAFAEGGSEKLAALNRRIAAVTNFLCEEDLPRADQMDIAWVPGYRSHLRAQKAGELFKAGKVGKIFLSGDSPYYADDEDAPTALTESLAMTVYLVDKRPDFGVHWDDVNPESTARETLENVDRSRRPLLAEKAEKRRALSILIVTSPYHLRRAWLMWLQFQHTHRELELIAELRRSASSAREELLPGSWQLNPKGIEAYMTECWKIHGGRATGEF